MGILNLTPDSFYDGDIDKLQNYELVKKSFDHISDSDIIDIGGESSRPESKPISFEEEIINTILLNNRKQELFDKLRDSIYNYSTRGVDYEIY